MSFELKDGFEIASDLLGLASALALALPVIRITKTRAKLNRQIIEVLKQDPNDTAKLVPKLEEADRKVVAYDRRDDRWFDFGIWGLGLTVLLRVAFHLIDKQVI